MKTFLFGTLAVWLAVFSTGCNRDSVKVYHVENGDTSTPVAPPMTAPATPMANVDSNALPTPPPDMSSQLKFTVPGGWQEKPLSEMRVASFGISADGKSADISVIPLGGMAGGDSANVNRWRGQLGLPPLADDDLQKLAEKVEVSGQPAELYDIAGTSPDNGSAQRILAVIQHRDDATWFFKMIGDADLVEQQKPTFISFLKTFQLGAAAAPPAMDLSQLPPSHPPVPGMDTADTTASATDSGSKPTWTVPSDWQTGALEEFLVARYIIPGANGSQATVNVSALAGDGGGLLPNVNRWRQQVGLAPVVEVDLASLPVIDASGGKATVIDVSGTDGLTGKPARLVGVVLPFGGQTWFYKLMGDPDAVAQQKDAFLKFVQSAKYQ